MKKPLLFVFAVLSTGLYAQEHFSGINTSRRVGMLNASVNPAELVNLKENYEVNLFNFSVNFSNNKATFGELLGGGDEDFEDIIFAEGDPLNMRADIEIMGPAFGFKMGKWGFGVSTGAKVRADIVDLDVNLGRALTAEEDGEEPLSELINANSNQKLSASSCGEIGISAAREVFSNEEHSISAGVTFKLLFPGSYANMSADQFTGTVNITPLGDASLTDATADVDIAYSGSLAEDFEDSNSYGKFFAGGLNGFATDIGVNYRWKDLADTTATGYRLNAGLALKNMGSMTFKDDNNVRRGYEMNIPDGENFDLNQFEDAEGFEEVEEILINNPQYFTVINTTEDFKVKMPAVFSAYADVKAYGNWYATVYVQQKLNEDSNNDQIAVQNIVTFIPRYSARWFEAYIPMAHNEISGFTAGFGFRVGGFFLGSGSALSAALGETQQADLYFGFRFGF
jgi:hypothetical protein